MYEYNDYISTARRWLKWYNRFRTSIKLMEDDVQDLETQLEDDPELAAPVANYGNEPSGGTPELNKVESAVARRMRLEKIVEQKKKNIAELRRITHKVDEALLTFDKETQRLIRAHYIDGYDWRQVSVICHLSPQWTRKKGNKALLDMTNIIFGYRSRPPQIAYVFQE